jgi:hypothetical protein
MRCSIRTGLFLLLFEGAAQADEPPSAPSPTHAINEARLFMRKGWWEDARKDLEAALATPAGQSDYEIHYLLSQVCFELMDVNAAQAYSEDAARLSQSPSKAREASDFAKYLSDSFGTVEVQGPEPGMHSRLQIDLRYAQFDPDLKRFIKQQTLQLKEKTTLPVRVSLPVGKYAINGKDVVVEPSGVSVLDLPISALGARGLAALQVPRVELGAGFSVLFGERLSDIHPGPEVQAAFIQPIGGALLGITANEALLSYGVSGYDTVTDLDAWSVGLRLGTQIFVNGPLAIRPSVGYRYGHLPGVALDCSATDLVTQTDVVCRAPSSGSDPLLRFYTTAPIHVPYAELSIDYREAGRTTAMGVGVQVGVDEVLGVIPASAKATFHDPNDPSASGRGTPISVKVADGFFYGTGLRLLANLSIAF